MGVGTKLEASRDFARRQLGVGKSYRGGSRVCSEDCDSVGSSEEQCRTSVLKGIVESLFGTVASELNRTCGKPDPDRRSSLLLERYQSEGHQTEYIGGHYAGEDLQW